MSTKLTTKLTVESYFKAKNIFDSKGNLKPRDEWCFNRFNLRIDPQSIPETIEEMSDDDTYYAADITEERKGVVCYSTVTVLGTHRCVKEEVVRVQKRFC